MTYHMKGCRALIVALFIVSIVMLTGCAFPASDEPAPAEPEAVRKLLVAAHGDEHHPPTAPRSVRAVYRLISHTLELRVTPPKHFGTNVESLRRYEYQVNGGAWQTLTGATCLSWSTWQDGWTSGAACLAEDVLMLIAKVPITATGRVAYGVRAIGDSPGGVETVHVTIAEPGEDRSEPSCAAAGAGDGLWTPSRQLPDGRRAREPPEHHPGPAHQPVLRWPVRQLDHRRRRADAAVGGSQHQHDGAGAPRWPQRARGRGEDSPPDSGVGRVREGTALIKSE